MTEGTQTAASNFKEDGNAKFKAGNYAEAVEAYNRSLELDAAQHLVFSNRSAAYMKMGGTENLEASLKDARMCVELSPAFSKGYSRQAAALQGLKRWEEAAAICEQGLTHAPDDTLKKMQKEVENRKFQERMLGHWHGTVNVELGGYCQEMEFLEDGRVCVSVLGRCVVGTFGVDVASTPHHLNIEVPIPDAPPGMPPPPPVQYIIRVDDAGMHLCCPFRVLERPGAFEGPGYCVMKSGKAAMAGDAAELVGKSEDDKFLLCALEVIEALPSSKMEEPQPSDGEDVAREKLMVQVKLEAGMYAVKTKFGEELMTKVLGAAKGDLPVSEHLTKAKELTDLKDRMVTCGLIDPPAPGKDSAPAAPPAAPRPAAAPAAPAAEKQQLQAPQAPAADKGGDQTMIILAVAAGATALGAVGALLWTRSRRR